MSDPTVIVLTGAIVRAGMEKQEAALAEQMDANMRTAPGFISSKDYVAEDGEEITVIRFATDADLIRWRDEGLHGSYHDEVGRYYESFWVQTAEVRREYVFRDGDRTDGDLAWMFR
ncbi:MAG: hypothetical protein WD276_09365 [Actinomycetota bacterium]